MNNTQLNGGECTDSWRNLRKDLNGFLQPLTKFFPVLKRITAKYKIQVGHRGAVVRVLDSWSQSCGY